MTTIYAGILFSLLLLCCLLARRLAMNNISKISYFTLSGIRKRLSRVPDSATCRRSAKLHIFPYPTGLFGRIRDHRILQSGSVLHTRNQDLSSHVPISTLLAICHPSGCTVVSDIVVGVCNRSQMRTIKCTCLIFGVGIDLDPS